MEIVRSVTCLFISLKSVGFQLQMERNAFLIWKQSKNVTAVTI